MFDAALNKITGDCIEDIFLNSGGNVCILENDKLLGFNFAILQ